MTFHYHYQHILYLGFFERQYMISENQWQLVALLGLVAQLLVAQLVLVLVLVLVCYCIV
jgi:hypothetical protein